MTNNDAKIMREAGLRVLVCGGRDYDDRDHIWNTLTAIHGERRIGLVIHGAATGADSEGMLWADCMPGCKHAPFRADWRTHGKAAGPIRNQRMLDEGGPIWSWRLLAVAARLIWSAAPRLLASKSGR